MLNLMRRPGETVILTTKDGTEIEVIINKIVGNQVHLSFNAPREVLILRKELEVPLK